MADKLVVDLSKPRGNAGRVRRVPLTPAEEAEIAARKTQEQAKELERARKTRIAVLKNDILLLVARGREVPAPMRAELDSLLDVVE